MARPMTPGEPAFDVKAYAYRDDVVVLACRGDLDAATAPRLAESIRHAVEGGSAHLVVDLSDLDFLAAAGMTVLVVGHGATASAGKRFAVVASGPRTSRPMELVGLNNELNLHPTLDAALATLGGR